MNGTSLNKVSEFKDVGVIVIVTQSLTWNSHIDRAVCKANKLLGLIKRAFKGLCDVTLKTLYCSLVRSQLEYCSVVWFPNTKKNIDKIELVQKRAKKMILKSNSDYETRVKNLNLRSLQQRQMLCYFTRF